MSDKKNNKKRQGKGAKNKLSFRLKRRGSFIKAIDEKQSSNMQNTENGKENIDIFCSSRKTFVLCVPKIVNFKKKSIDYDHNQKYR